MTDFVDEGSIGREIWGNSDMILLVFTGAAAEFALNSAVDWLFFTNRLPADPIGRLLSAAAFAPKIFFAPESAARRTIERINAIPRGNRARSQRAHSRMGVSGRVLYVVRLRHPRLRVPRAPVDSRRKGGNLPGVPTHRRPDAHPGPGGELHRILDQQATPPRARPGIQHMHLPALSVVPASPRAMALPPIPAGAGAAGPGNGAANAGIGQERAVSRGLQTVQPVLPYLGEDTRPAGAAARRASRRYSQFRSPAGSTGRTRSRCRHRKLSGCPVCCGHALLSHQS